MTVERIGPLDPPSNVKKPEKPAQPRTKSDVDSINVSQEARTLAAASQAQESVRSAADVRVDKVEEAKRKLQDPTYPSQEVIEKTAEGIMKTFGI